MAPLVRFSTKIVDSRELSRSDFTNYCYKLPSQWLTEIVSGRDESTDLKQKLNLSKLTGTKTVSYNQTLTKRNSFHCVTLVGTNILKTLRHWVYAAENLNYFRDC